MNHTPGGKTRVVRQEVYLLRPTLTLDVAQLNVGWCDICGALMESSGDRPHLIQVAIAFNCKYGYKMKFIHSS